MHLHRLIIKNYRSIRELELVFEKGKNVIVGRNNSGKTNIVKALDIVLGGSSPTWAKSENITEKDFHTYRVEKDGNTTTVTEKQIFIWAELHRDSEETLDFLEINNCSGFGVYSEAGYGNDRNAELIRKDDVPNNYQTIMTIPDESRTRIWAASNLKNQWRFDELLQDKHQFGYMFWAKLGDDGSVQRKEMRFLFRKDADSDWYLGLRATIRNELLQSAILPSFRDPQNQLRINVSIR